MLLQCKPQKSTAAVGSTAYPFDDETYGSRLSRFSALLPPFLALIAKTQAVQDECACSVINARYGAYAARSAAISSGGCPPTAKSSPGLRARDCRSTGYMPLSSLTAPTAARTNRSFAKSRRHVAVSPVCVPDTFGCNEAQGLNLGGQEPHPSNLCVLI